ncbi:hypothetical protein D3C76_1641020 [compost metagenome]
MRLTVPLAVSSSRKPDRTFSRRPEAADSSIFPYHCMDTVYPSVILREANSRTGAAEKAGFAPFPAIAGKRLAPQIPSAASPARAILQKPAIPPIIPPPIHVLSI